MGLEPQTIVEVDYCLRTPEQRKSTGSFFSNINDMVEYSENNVLSTPVKRNLRPRSTTVTYYDKRPFSYYQAKSAARHSDVVTYDQAMKSIDKDKWLCLMRCQLYKKLALTR